MISIHNNAFWFCVEKLAKNQEQNRKVLDELKFLSTLNGTEKIEWESIVERKNLLEKLQFMTSKT